VKRGVAARVCAATLVGRVVREGAWSNVVARTIDLPPDDAALARRLLYETVRNRRRIDRAISGLSSRLIWRKHHVPADRGTPPLIFVGRFSNRDWISPRAFENEFERVGEFVD